MFSHMSVIKDKDEDEYEYEYEIRDENGFINYQKLDRLFF